MQDIDLYQHLLGLTAPWFVARVELNVSEQRVDVWVEHPAGQQWPCPECGELCATYDHTKERSWRHLDSCQFLTFLHAAPPRVKCAEHGVRQVALPWAEPRARFTALFERWAIDLLMETNVSGAARILRLSWDEVWGIMERAVRRGLHRKGERISRFVGVDEKAAHKGHRYITLVCDLELGTVEYFAEDRKQSSLDGYFESLTPAQLEGIEAIAMDMWRPYIRSTLTHLPDAASKIVFDRYHVMWHVNRAVDTVRKQQHRTLLKRGDPVLKGTKYLWLYGAENLPVHRREEFERLRKACGEMGRAWAIKESLREIWNCSDRTEALLFWRRWYGWAVRSRLSPIKAAAKTVKSHLRNVLTYFTHRVTNAAVEGINSVIQTVKKMACGYRNNDHFRIAVYFHKGGLDLYPLVPTHTKPG